MWSSPLFWIAVAVLVFWGVGAYNRLARLRSLVLQKEAVLMEEMVSFLSMLDELQAKMIDQALPVQPESLQSLVEAAASLSAFMPPQALNSLKSEKLHALANTLHALKKCALSSAQVDALLPETPSNLLLVRLADIAARIAPLGLQLQHALSQYNEAVMQFPASILAKVCGFGVLSVDIFSTNQEPHATP
jgi:LemA protein